MLLLKLHSKQHRLNLQMLLKSSTACNHCAAHERHRSLQRKKHDNKEYPQVDSLDDTAALAIEEMLAKAVASRKRFFVCGAGERVMAIFARLSMIDQMAIAPNASRQAALEAALA